MRKKIARKTVPLLCSFLIFTVPWVSAGASQLGRATTQGINAVGFEATHAPSKSENPSAATAEGSESESGPKEESITETETEVANTESLANTKEEPAALQETEAARNENAVTEPDDSITLIETESAIDADGNVTMTFNTSESLKLPVIMTMKGAEGTVSMTVSRSGQEIKIKPDTYDITKAVDGNGKKLPSGARLTIPEEGGIVYLDFDKPGGDDNTAIDFLKTNCWFLVIAALLVYLYRKYFHQ